jgi:hypothetical protein
LELEDLGAARDPATQVRRFLAGIKSDGLRSMKFTILNDPECQQDLQTTVIRAQDLWNQTKPSHPAQIMAALVVVMDVTNVP